MQNELPEWAMEEAAALRSAVIWQSNAANQIIARALVAAERQGIERAAECVDALTTDDLPEDFIGHAASFGDVIDLAVAAIRQLGETT